MESAIKEENKNINTEDSLENTTINITIAESTAVKEVKEETGETEDPLLVIPGQCFNREKVDGVGRDVN